MHNALANRRRRYPPPLSACSNRPPSLLQHRPNHITNYCGWIGIAKPSIITGESLVPSVACEDWSFEAIHQSPSNSLKSELRLISSRGNRYSSPNGTPHLNAYTSACICVLRSIAVSPTTANTSIHEDEKAALVPRLPPGDLRQKLQRVYSSHCIVEFTFDSGNQV